MSLGGSVHRQGSGESQSDNRVEEFDEEVTCMGLCDILERGGVCDETFWSLVQIWTREFDMGAPVDKDCVMNSGHVYGQALTVYAYQNLKTELGTFCIESTLDSFAPSICIQDLSLIHI